jgi:hypothetical protein
VPFREHATSFTPEQLEIMSTAFHAAVAELSTSRAEISHQELAQRILDRAAEGVFDVAELTRAAMDGLVRDK